MIYNDPSIKISEKQKRRFISKGVIIDSWVLTLYFIYSYVVMHPDKSFLLDRCKDINSSKIDCLNTILTNFRINKFIVTPQIFSEFLNHIRNNFKEDYKIIFKEFKSELEKFEEAIVQNKKMLKHEEFCNFLNDISLYIATNNQIEKNKYSCIMSFDGRFINKFFIENENILAFDLGVLQYF